MSTEKAVEFARNFISSKPLLIHQVDFVNMARELLNAVEEKEASEAREKDLLDEVAQLTAACAKWKEKANDEGSLADARLFALDIANEDIKKQAKRASEFADKCIELTAAIAVKDDALKLALGAFEHRWNIDWKTLSRAVNKTPAAALEKQKRVEAVISAAIEINEIINRDEAFLAAGVGSALRLSNALNALDGK